MMPVMMPCKAFWSACASPPARASRLAAGVAPGACVLVVAASRPAVWDQPPAPIMTTESPVMTRRLWLTVSVVFRGGAPRSSGGSAFGVRRAKAKGRWPVATRVAFWDDLQAMPVARSSGSIKGTLRARALARQAGCRRLRSEPSGLKHPHPPPGGHITPPPLAGEPLAVPIPAMPAAASTPQPPRHPKAHPACFKPSPI